jgi:hypothetical protein
MTVIEIIHTHPFAAGIAVGIVLAYGSLALCAVLLFTLEKTKALARATTKPDPDRPRVESSSRQLFSDSSVGSPDSTIIT